MKIRIGDSVVTPAVTPVAFIFSSDAERRWMAEQLLNIPDKDRVSKAFVLGPAKFNEDQDALIQFVKESLNMAENVG